MSHLPRLFKLTLLCTGLHWRAANHPHDAAASKVLTVEVDEAGRAAQVDEHRGTSAPVHPHADTAPTKLLRETNASESIRAVSDKTVTSALMQEGTDARAKTGATQTRTGQVSDMCFPSRREAVRMCKMLPCADFECFTRQCPTGVKNNDGTARHAYECRRSSAPHGDGSGSD
jgi:hypothetical protein